MTDNEIVKALECCISSITALACFKCPMVKNKECNGSNTNVNKLVVENALALITRQKAEIERLKEFIEKDQGLILKLTGVPVNEYNKKIKSEAYREFADKITEVFMRYAHIHQYAEEARRDYIEAVDGTNIEMQSVWDVCTLEKNGMAEYEEMGRLQKNIETIEKERLLTELEKDFRLLTKELTEK